MNHDGFALLVGLSIGQLIFVLAVPSQAATCASIIVALWVGYWARGIRDAREWRDEVRRRLGMDR